MSLSVVLKHLPNLKPVELEQIKQRVNFLLGTANGSPTKDSAQDWLLEGLTAELRRRGLWAGSKSIPVRLFPVEYAAKSEVVRRHLLKGFAKPLRHPAERMALGGLAGGVLAEYLFKAKVPLGPKTLLANVDKIPQALEAAFPWYWANGLLGFCIKVKV